MRIIGGIPTIDSLDEIEIRKQIDRNEPAIIAGTVPNWTAYERWSRDHLVREVGGVEIEYRYSTSNVHPPLGGRSEEFAPINRTARLADYLDISAESPRVFLDANLVCLYARRGRANPALAPLARDLQLPSFLEPADLDTVGLWISGEGVRTRLHYDRNGRHNLNAQLAGSKQVVLVSPDQVTNLYPFPMSAPTYNFSEVDSTAPNLTSFPAYAEVTAFEATLNAGDLLFLPAFWYHDFTHLGEFNLNLNFWFDATNVRLSAVALRNEIATIWARARGTDDERWNRLGEALDRYCLSWSPSRATVDELDADGQAARIAPPPFLAQRERTESVTTAWRSS